MALVVVSTINSIQLLADQMKQLLFTFILAKVLYELDNCAGRLITAVTPNKIGSSKLNMHFFHAYAQYPRKPNVVKCHGQWQWQIDARQRDVQKYGPLDEDLHVICFDYNYYNLHSKSIVLF